MLDRRAFLGHLVPPAAVLAAGTVALPRRAASALAELAATAGDAEAIARDERYWFEVQRAFTLDRGIVNFNNGGVCPAPAIVQEAMARNLAFSNEAPAYTMWRVLEPQKEAVRERMARFLGCDTEEVAFTRNASESLQICQLGLDLERGDEVLTTTHDYPRMITTFRQRERRDGIVLRQFPLPIPAEDPAEVVRRFEQNVTPRTRLILVSHMVNITGQILPVREVVAMARRRGIPAIVDGAHSFGHFPFRIADLDCDYFASSLHKWLFAPFGTGLLYVRRERIAGLWPLMAAEAKQDADIRKFEEIGTHPCPNHLAIGDALTFHQGIGPERKAARLIYLRDRWARRLAEQPGVRLHTSLAPGFACGIATVQLEGIPSLRLADHLWERHRIFTVAIEHPEFEGIRVSPSVYSTLEEVDRFAEAMEAVLRNGIPTAP